MFSAIFSLARSFMFTYFTVASSSRLHGRLLHKVLRFSQSFFDVYVQR